MNAIWQERLFDAMTPEADPLSGEPAEAYGVLTGEEAGEEDASEEAAGEDIFPLHELLQGCIWRDTHSAQAKAGLLEEEPELSAADTDRWRELDFSEERHGTRGFLDEDISLFLPQEPV